MRNSMDSHLRLLVRADTHIAERLRPAKQNETRGGVLGEVRIGGRVIDSSGNQHPCTCETASLTANGGEFYAAPRSGVPQILIREALDCLDAGRSFENYAKGPLHPHLGIVKAAVLAVRSLARFAAPEVARRNRFAIALVRQ